MKVFDHPRRRVYQLTEPGRKWAFDQLGLDSSPTAHSRTEAAP